MNKRTVAPCERAKKLGCGSMGVGYLRKMLDVVLFPELWKVRNDL